MEAKKLDDVCCEFASVQTVKGHPHTQVPGHPDICWCAVCFEPASEHSYPKVSTDGSAMLQLMDALKLMKGMHLTIGISRSGLYRAEIRRVTAANYPNWINAENESAPMALALAVAELAKASQ